MQLLAVSCVVFTSLILATDAVPSLLPDGKVGIEIWSELIDSAGAVSFTIRERFDKRQSAYSLEYFDPQDNRLETLYYGQESNKLFFYNDFACSGYNANETEEVYRKLPFSIWLRLRHKPENAGFLGPASYLERFAKLNSTTPPASNCTNDRKIPCDEYSANIDGTHCAFQYTKQKYPIFGQTASVPILAKIGITDVQILDIKFYDADSSFAVFAPTGISCQVPDVDNLLTVYSYPFEFEAELVFNSYTANTTYVSQLSGLATTLFSSPSNPPDLYSFTFSLWQQDENSSAYKAWFKERVIFDEHKNMYYEHYYSKDARKTDVYEWRCEKRVSLFDERPTLVLQDFGEIDLRPLFLATPTGAKISHLGANRIRNNDVDVFEATFTKYETGTQTLERFVVTYYYDLLLGYPLTIELRGFNDTSNLFKASINIAMYKQNPTQLNEKLSVEDCYKDDRWGDTYAHWFQIGFEVRDRSRFDAVRQATQTVKESFLKQMYLDFNLSPMRIPQVTVDIVEEQIRVNALLLEMINIEDNFGSIWSKDLIKSRGLGIMSLWECQARCMAMRERECTGISYCGSVCSVTDVNNPLAAVNLVDDDFCHVSSRKSNVTHVTSDEVLKGLKDAINNPDESKRIMLSVELTSEQGNETVILRSDSFDETQDFQGAFHYQRGKSPVIETSFKLAATKQRFTIGKTEKNLGSFPLDDCAVACRNRDDCESFSYCQNSRECVISQVHDVRNIGNQSDNNCVVYQIKYTDRFEKFPGLTIKKDEENTLAMNTDSCAQRCLANEDCKSFEYCEKEGNCFILGAHMSDSGSGAQRSTDYSCSHFSKKYIYDYKKKASTMGTDPVNVLADFSGVTESECSKRCTEWPSETEVCLSFDFCDRQRDNTGTCTLRTINGEGKTSAKDTCDFYFLKDPKALVKSQHGAGAAFGLSMMMLLIGIGLAIGGLLAYGKFFSG